jgi:hypothetical protein
MRKSDKLKNIELANKNLLGEDVSRHEIGSHEEMIDHGKGTKWWPSSKRGESAYNMYSEKYGPFIVYKGNGVKIACIGDDCYKDNDNKVTREEAALLLGVDSLEEIQ